MSYYPGIEIGGTKVQLIAADYNFNIVKRLSYQEDQAEALRRPRKRNQNT